jgi:hypothetical protein
MEQARHRDREVHLFQKERNYPAAYVGETHGHREDERQIHALLHVSEVFLGEFRQAYADIESKGEDEERRRAFQTVEQEIIDFAGGPFRKAPEQAKEDLSENEERRVTVAAVRIARR